SDEEAAHAFIIEWSKDRSTTQAVATPAGGADWAGLRAAALKQVRSLEAKYAKALAANGKAMKWDLDFWQRGLPNNEARTFSPAVARYRAKVKPDGSIDIDENERLLLPPRGVKIIRDFIAKEKQLEAIFERELDKARIAYIKKLEEKKATAQSSGLASQMRAIQNEIEACGTSGKTHLEHFGPGS
ncbi:MAG: hypothetical protein GWO24_25965, partial [Akkermansiaceae bacterium]|nr:hypothetical protein [Akkermansiaceae bacterium]